MAPITRVRDVTRRARGLRGLLPEPTTQPSREKSVRRVPNGGTPHIIPDQSCKLGGVRDTVPAQRSLRGRDAQMSCGSWWGGDPGRK